MCRFSSNMKKLFKGQVEGGCGKPHIVPTRSSGSNRIGNLHCPWTSRGIKSSWPSKLIARTRKRPSTSCFNWFKSGILDRQSSQRFVNQRIVKIPGDASIRAWRCPSVSCSEKEGKTSPTRGALAFMDRTARPRRHNRWDNFMTPCLPSGCGLEPLLRPSFGCICRGPQRIEHGTLGSRRG